MEESSHAVGDDADQEVAKTIACMRASNLVTPCLYCDELVGASWAVLGRPISRAEPMLFDCLEEEEQGAKRSPARLLRPWEACRVFPCPPVLYIRCTGLAPFLSTTTLPIQQTVHESSCTQYPNSLHP